MSNSILSEEYVSLRVPLIANFQCSHTTQIVMLFRGKDPRIPVQRNKSPRRLHPHMHVTGQFHSVPQSKQAVNSRSANASTFNCYKRVCVFVW